MPELYVGGRALDDIFADYEDRKKARAPIFAQMRSMRDMVNGDIAIPLTELHQNERPAVANLAQQGLDAMGQRVGSVLPDMYYPPLRPGIQKSENLARQRRQVNLGWWEHNRMKIKMRRRARHYLAYSCAPVTVEYDHKRKMPLWRLRDPLGTFPAPSSDPDELTPDDCMFVFTQPFRWLQRNYPDQAAKVSDRDTKPTDLFELLEYVDDECTVLAVIGKRRYADWQSDTAGVPRVVLERYPNRAGLCPAVVPGRITLDRPQGQFDGMLGMFMQQAELAALAVIAAKKGVFPELWLVAAEGSNAQIITHADGLRGVMGEVQGGTIVPVQTDPGYMTNPTIDRLERGQRLQGGIPAELGGEAGSNIRTGRRGSQLLSAVIDFPVQEAQEVFAESLKEENRRAISFDKAYGRGSKAMYVSWKGAKGRVDYKPKDTWETDEQAVSYAFAGADTNGLVIEAGQRIGMGTLSKQSFMEVDPLVDDPEGELARIINEGVDMALLSSIQTQAADPASPLQMVDLAYLRQQLATGNIDLAEAVDKMQQRAQERQATQVPADAPEAMPGVAPPGMGAEMQTIPEDPMPSMEGLSGLLASLRRPQQTIPAER